jgi:hypothetical protein
VILSCREVDLLCLSSRKYLYSARDVKIDSTAGLCSDDNVFNNDRGPEEAWQGF